MKDGVTVLWLKKILHISVFDSNNLENPHSALLGSICGVFIGLYFFIFLKLIAYFMSKNDEITKFLDLCAFVDIIYSFNTPNSYTNFKHLSK